MNKPLSKIFKTEDIKNRAFKMHPLCFMLIGEMCSWAWANNLPFTVTDTHSTPEEDKRLKRQSATHREGRAFDVSTKTWPQKSIEDFIQTFTKKYSNIAAVSSDGKPALIVHHDTGHGDHFHVQINKRFMVADTP